MPAPYEIAARLTLTSNAPQVFALLSRDILGVEGGLKRLEEAFKSLNRTTVALGGALAMAFGGGVVIGMKALADKGAELSNELAKMKNLGMSDADLVRMKGAAFGMHAQVPGATTLDAAKVLNTTYSLFGADNAIKMLKPLLEFEQLLGATTGNYKQAEEKILSMVRAGDLMGKFVDTVTHQIDIGKLQHFLDLASKVQQATHGRVSAAQWLALAQQGGPALSTMTDEGLVTMSMVAQAMGGHRAGTALSSLFTQFKGGLMSKWRAQQLIDLGLLPKDAIQEVSTGGHIVWSKGALDTPFAQALGTDPMAAVGMLSGAMSAHGITSPEEQIKTIFQLAQRQTSVRELHDILRNMPQMEQERTRILGAAGTGQALATFNAESYERNIHNLDAAWQTLLIHVGSPLAQAAIPVLQNLTAVIDKLIEAAQRHPGVIRDLAIGITALGAAFASAGAGMLLAAIGPVGWFVGGMVALAAIKWDWMSAGLKAAVTGFETLATAAAKLPDTLNEAVKSFQEFGSKLWATIKELLHNITHLGGLIPGSYGGGGIGGGGLIPASYGGSSSSWTGSTIPGSGATSGFSADLLGAGAGNPMVAKYLRDGGHGLNPVQQAWCAAYVGSWLKHHGYDSLGSNVATSYLNYGTAAGGDVHVGDVAVFPRGHAAGQTGGHVGIVAGVHGGYADILAGNTGHRVAMMHSRIGSFVARHPVHPNHGRIGTVRPYHGGDGGNQVQANLFLDGKLVASNVIGHVMKSAQFATQGPHFSGWDMYQGGQGQLNSA